MKKYILIAAALACFLPQALCAATLRVPADYPTIQAAVDAAASGDTVLVADGAYTGAGNCGVVISKSITVASENGPGSTTLDCPDSFGVALDLLGTNQCPQINLPNQLDLPAKRRP